MKTKEGVKTFLGDASCANRNRKSAPPQRENARWRRPRDAFSIDPFSVDDGSARAHSPAYHRLVCDFRRQDGAQGAGTARAQPAI